MMKLAINGFGRIGRAAFKIALEEPTIEVVAINDLGDIENLAYLLRYDTIYGRYGRPVSVEGASLLVGKKKIAVLGERDPRKLPWKDLGVDVVIESTGVFTEEEGARGHIEAGARRVIISAPSDSESISTVLMGVNEKELAGKEIISNASCTTNSAAPVMSVLQSAFGIEKALLTTVHAYTATQSLVDGPATKDFRRGRAAAANLVPSSTGAALATTRALPALAGKFDGIALRVPLTTVSISDITAVVSRAVSVEEVQQAFRDAAQGLLSAVLGVTEDPVVSADFIGDPRSAIVDLPLTRVVGGDLVKVMAWYDNEWGYSNRLVEQVVAVGKDV
jgi:glyceraldehyde 3-phosphate dehydrogenase